MTELGASLSLLPAPRLLALSKSPIALDFDNTVVFQIVIFSLLIVVLKPLLFDPMLKVFGLREERTEGAKAIARELEEQAGELLQRYAADAQDAPPAPGAPALQAPGAAPVLPKHRKKRPNAPDAPAPPPAPAPEMAVQAPATPKPEAEPEHAPTFSDVNWYYGFLGEKAGVEPSLLWRPKGTPVPFAALALNTLALYWLLYRFGKKPIMDALRQRKESIMRGMEEAAALKAEAEQSLAKYKKKLDDVDQEVARIRSEMREAGESERQRILSEAKERRARLERDARTLIEQELKAAREQLPRA